MSYAVRLEEATKSFGPKRAVDALDLAAPTGSIYGFVGPNGSGKTTALRLMLRIYQPDSGRVEVLGVDHGGVADDRVGYLPEERGLYKRMKVANLITYFARLKGVYDCRAAVADWLERLGASSWANQRVDTLSKGMAQKVQFIIAVIARPQLVILDEPFSGLDPVNLELLAESVQSLRENGTTVVFSTHDMNVAERLCDTILMIFQGKKVLDGSLDEIQSQYPSTQLKLRLTGGQAPPHGLPGVASLRDTLGGHLLHLEDSARPQEILQRVAEAHEVEHFEVVKPTLHDIFVDIARPADNGADVKEGN